MQHDELRTVGDHQVYTNQRSVRLYDENENFVKNGTVDEAVENGLWCRSVHVWLFDPEGNVCIQKRSMQVMNNPGKWAEASGGYVEGDATPLETVEEEVREELGISIPSLAYANIGMIRQIERRLDDGETRQFVDVYLVEHNFNDENITLFKRDVSEVATVPFRELQKKIEAKEIDFVDHPEEIALVFSELSKRFQ